MHAIDPKPGRQIFGINMLLHRGRTLFIADTQIHELPSAEVIADIAQQAAEFARGMGHEPRVALLSFSSFGNPPRERAMRIREAIAVLDARGPDFEYDGEMQVSVALDYTLMQELYPFCRLSGPASVLVMPALHAANISTQLMQELGAGTMIGPLLHGLAHPVQIVGLGASVNDLVNAAALASYSALSDRLG